MNKATNWVRAFVALFAVTLLLRVVTGNRTPNIKIPPPPPLPRPNAFDTYQTATKCMAPGDDVGNSSIDRDGKPFKPDMWAKRADVLAANRDALRLARVGLTQEYYQPPNRDTLAEHPYLKGYRSLARLFALDANNRFASGDTSGGASAALEGVAFGEQVARGGGLRAREISVACQAITRRSLWLNVNRLDAVTALTFARRLESLAARRVPLAETLTEEKRIAQTSLAQVFTGEYFRKHPPPPSNDEDKNKTEPLPSEMVFAIEPKRQTFDHMTAYMDALISSSNKPYAERKPAPAVPGEILNGLLLPYADGKFFKETASEETQTALLIAALAVRAYRAEHGAFPADLQTLVTKGYLRRVPADPFARGGATLRYKSGVGMVYSVGPDGADNGGAPIDDLSRSPKARYQAIPESRGDIVAGVNDY